MPLIDGRQIANDVNTESTALVEQLKNEHGVVPGLAVVLIGDDPASRVYVNMKAKTSTRMGMRSEKFELPADASQADVLALVDQLNNDPDIHGILVQSPPPPQIDERAVIEALNPAKDVDCFHPYNVGKMLIGDVDGFLPCTPLGVMVLLQRSGVETSGRNAVVLGRSNIVGKPMAALLSRRGADATVTMCHSRTADLADVCRRADIVVAAIGRANFVTADMVKDGAVVIDVGINRVDDPAAKRGYRLVGDVDFDAVVDKASLITPVPGGVGPMTIAMLLRNAIIACCRQHGLPVNAGLLG